LVLVRISCQVSRFFTSLPCVKESPNEEARTMCSGGSRAYSRSALIPCEFALYRPEEPFGFVVQPKVGLKIVYLVFPAKSSSSVLLCCAEIDATNIGEKSLWRTVLSRNSVAKEAVSASA